MPEDRTSTDETPIACSLEAAELQQRLAALAAVGGESLLSRLETGGRNRLRFRGGSATRMRLTEIVAAERACCPFLDLSLTEQGDELLLTIEGSGEGRAVADELAGAFGPPAESD